MVVSKRKPLPTIYYSPLLVFVFGGVEAEDFLSLT